ncbi:MAG TPA: LuxR C-terminal-related transcriptional regulator [Tepidiformaceae bacterium]|nr:LuxR C-terminal-related transcriptional regulator [Tepidiformaceae bacterium]
MTRLALDLAGRRQLILVVDDLHLAGAAAIASFTELVRNLADRSHHENARILLIATCHPQLPGDLLEATLTHIKREPIVLGLTVDGLDEPETAELLRHAFTERCAPVVIDAVQRASHGNPLFVLELAANLRDRDLVVEDPAGLRPRASLGELVLPHTAPEAIARRLESLPDDSRHLLRMAAVYGDEFAPADLLTVCPGFEVERVIDAATREGLIEPRGGAFAFHHHLIRHALLEAMGPLERKAAHRRIADALLERAPDDPAQLVTVAIHLLECDGADHNQDELGSLYERAGDAAMTVFARATALRLYEAALATAPYVETLTRRQLGWLQVRTARANDNAGDGARARGLYFQAVQNLRLSTDFQAWGLAVLGWERTYTVASEPIPTVSYEQEFAERSGEAGRDLRIRLLTQRADALQLARDPADIEVARAAVELAEQSQDAAARAEAFATMGLVLMRHLEPRAALTSFDASRIAAADDPNPIFRGWGWSRRAWPLILMGHLSDAQRSAGESSAFGRRNNHWAGAALAEAFGHSASVLRPSPQVQPSAAEALLMIGRSNYLQASFILDSAVAWHRLLMGEFDEAADAAAQWERLAGGLGALPLRALIDVARGQRPRVIETLGMRPWRPSVRGETDFVSLGSLCASAELAGSLETQPNAERVYELLSPLPGRGIVFSLAPPILIERSLGICARILGQRSLAEGHLLRADRIAAESGAATEGALVALERLRLATQVGSISGAQLEAGASAARHFPEHGLLWPLEATLNLLRNVPRSKAALHLLPDQLSPTEREVLEEHDRGATESQVAQRLLLSERTVHDHLARAQARLAHAAAPPSAESPGQPPALAELTPREREVLSLIALGRTNAQIAEELIISQHTAIRHVANILAKTGSANRTEAARLLSV